VANDDARLIAPVTAEQAAKESEAAKPRTKAPKAGSSDQGSLF